MPDRPILNTAFCLDIVIDATNNRELYRTTFRSNSNTLLSQLGVVPPSVDDFKSRVQHLLNNLHYSIKQADIDAATSVAACVVSVRSHAN